MKEAKKSYRSYSAFNFQENKYLLGKFQSHSGQELHEHLVIESETELIHNFLGIHKTSNYYMKMANYKKISKQI